MATAYYVCFVCRSIRCSSPNCEKPKCKALCMQEIDETNVWFDFCRPCVRKMETYFTIALMPEPEEPFNPPKLEE